VVLLLLWTEFSVGVVQPGDNIYQTVTQFKKTGSVCDKHVKGFKHSASVCMAEVNTAEEAKTGNP
jgi:hypothetical protein